MNTSVETLIRILDEERTGRNKAEERVATALLNLLDSQLELQKERDNFERRVKSIREEQNYDYDRIRREGDRLQVAALQMARTYLVPSIFAGDQYYYRRNKIPFIQVVREQSGLGLKESKDLVDQFLADLPVEEGV